MTHITTIPSKVNVIIVVCHGALDRHEPVVFLRGEVGKMYPNRGQEGDDGTKSNLSRRNTAEVLRNVQSLDKHI